MSSISPQRRHCLHAAISVLIGGVIRAFIFGCYWVITSVLFGMHQDAFSALGIKDYKNFLRMKLEENKLTDLPHWAPPRARPARLAPL